MQEKPATTQQAGSTRRLTVAHIMPWAGIGGVEIATLRLAEAMQNQVNHVPFCLSDAHALRQSFERLGIECLTYTPPEPSVRHFGKYYKDSLAIASQLRRMQVDIVHFADEKAAYHNSLAALLAKTSRVCHMRVSYPQLDLRNRLCLLPVHKFVFVSNEALQTFAISLPPGKSRVIYDAVDIPDVDEAECRASVEREFDIPANSTVVGTIARVSPQKDYFTLADAAVEVLEIHPNTRFLIVGDNSLVELNRRHYQEVIDRLDTLRIRDKFIFTGHRDDTVRLTAAMDFCVLSTHREGFPLSILESMALKKPVCATSVGGIPEIVQPGVNGYLHSHGNSKELTQAIIALIEDRELIVKMGKAAQEHVRRNHSRDKFVREVMETYKQTAS